jgi:chromosome segregation ATPase
MLVTSLAPGARFSEVCETLVVSAHGCLLRSPMKLETGVPVHLHSEEGRQTMAQVVFCQPMGPNQQGWRLGARLDKPENFWGLKACPDDWTGSVTKATISNDKFASALRPATTAGSQSQPAAAVRAELEKIQRQISDEHLRSLIAGLVQPLQQEIADLREKLSHAEPKRSRFEVSLSHIPPELEEQLEQRLRKDLTTQVLAQTREQSAQVLEEAKTAISQKTDASHNEFRQQAAQQVQAVEQRAQRLSVELTEGIRQNLRTGLGELHQQVVEAGNRLERRSEDLLQALRYSLGEEIEAYRREMQQAQGTVASESARLQAQVADLDGRIAKLDETTLRLEADFDQRLEQMTDNTLGAAKAHLDGTAEQILRDLAARSTKELSHQVDEACNHLQIIQKGIQASASEALRNQVAEAVRSFEQSMHALAEQSVDRWRVTLANGLNSVARNLGDQFHLEAGNGSGRGSD